MYSEGQEVDIRIMEVNTANNKMSLSMLPPTEEAGEFFFSCCLVLVGSGSRKYTVWPYLEESMCCRKRFFPIFFFFFFLQPAPIAPE